MANPSPEKAEMNLIEQAVMDVVLSREGKRRYSNGDSLTLDPSDLRDIVRLTMAKCATPPSPSTAPDADEMIEAVADFRKATYEFARGQDPSDHALMMDRQKRIFEIFRAAIASRPAEVDDEGLPPLPASVQQVAIHVPICEDYPKHTKEGSAEPWEGYYTAEQYRQGQRDAVAADRARRGDINPADAFVLYSAADVIDECGNVLVALKVRGIADRVIMPEITKVPR